MMGKSQIVDTYRATTEKIALNCAVMQVMQFPGVPVMLTMECDFAKKICQDLKQGMTKSSRARNLSDGA